MAINSHESHREKVTCQSVDDYYTEQKGHIKPCLTASTSTSSKRTGSVHNSDKSPYLAVDKVHLLTKITEKKYIQKKAANFVSSFPLASNLYKASSHEFSKVLTRASRKPKKSVHTLPNDRAPIQKECTVSDMTESEYFETKEGPRNTMPRTTKPKTIKKTNSKRRDNPYAERDEQYCSDYNLNIYGSSTDTLGLENIRKGHGQVRGSKKLGKNNDNATITNDVWKVLRSINKFQFTPTPCLSEEGAPSVKKKKGTKKRNLHKNTRVVESNRTEECVFVSTVDYYENPRQIRSSTLSPNMSIITVMNENDEFNKICNKVKSSVIMNKKIQDDGHRSQNTRHHLTNKITKRVNIIKKGVEVVKTVANTGDNPNRRRFKNAGDDLNLKPKSKNLKKVENFVYSEIEDIPYVRGGINISNNDCKLTITHFRSPTEVGTMTNTHEVDKFENIDSDSSKAAFHRESCCSPKPLVSLNGRLATNQPKRGKPKLRPRIIGAMMGDGEYEISRQSGSINNYRKFRPKILPKSSGQAAMNSPDRNRVSSEKIKLEKQQVPLTSKDSDFNVPLMSDEKEKHLAEWFNENEYDSKHDQMNKKKRSMAHTPSPTKPQRETLSPNSLRSQESRSRNSKTILIASDQCFVSKSEIKKRLAKLRYPIVILGKDQVNTGVTIKSEDPPQFLGLDKNIWPFMQTWGGIKEIDQIHEKTRCKSPKTHSMSNIVPNANKYVYKDQDTFTETQLKKKSIHNLKDKMIKLFSSKRGNGEEFSLKQNNASINFESKKNARKGLGVKNTDASAVTNRKSFQNLAETMVSRSTEGTEISKKRRPSRILAQKRLASDFIENVMKKVKSGVYYSNEISTRSDAKNGSMKTILTAKPPTTSDSNSNALTSKMASEIVLTEYTDPFKNITGFDRVFDNLEVKTLNMYEIAVKHNITNVLVKFDVVSDAAALARQFQKPICTPVAVTGSRTQIFKCKTIIINQMLPAELCTLIPEMMKNLLHTNPFLPTITEIPTSLSSQDSIPILPLTRSIPTVISSKLRGLIDGIFGHYSKSCMHAITPRESVVPHGPCCREILPRLATSWLISYTQHSWRNLPILNLNYPLQNNAPEIELISSVNNCKSLIATPCNVLEPYKTLKHYVNDMKTTTVLSQMRDYFASQNIAKLDISTAFGPNNNFALNVVMESADNVIKVIKIDFYRFGVPPKSFTDIECDGINNAENNRTPLKCIEYFEKPVEKDVVKKHPSVVSLKASRRSYVKLYKKCKSTSNITKEETGTPLKKITSLDDFFQALGSAKTLSSVIDGGTGKIVMRSLLEMKNWISDISPRQALLVLLLSNKKDTNHLARLRPVILQAIAVNRITRASELDMEIEVIVKEKICQPQPECEDMSYLTTTTNRQCLLDELCWIAKTTASDYQKPFDESSEQLLKSLLQKRKQLNPSYLRVMARYVGLGLLKSPKEKVL